MLGCGSERFAVDFSQKSVKIFASEGPLEGRCRPFVVGLESKETLLELSQRREVVGRKDFPLNNREVDFDLVEPTGVDRSVDKNGIGPFGAETVGGLLATMSGAVVHDPEDAASGLVGLLAHDFADQTIHRSDAVFDFTAAEDFGAMDVPGRQVGPGAFAKVLMLDSHGAGGSRRQRRLFSASGLNAGLLVCGDHEVIGAQWARPPKCARTGRGRDRPWPQNRDREGRSNCDVARGAGRRC